MGQSSVGLLTQNRPPRGSSAVLVAELVHGDGGVLGVGVAGVQVAVVLGDQVHVVEEEAVPVLLPHGLPEPDVHQLGPVKRVGSSLRSGRVRGKDRKEKVRILETLN